MKSNWVLINLIFLLVGLRGIFQISPIPITYYKLFLDFFILCLFIRNLNKRYNGILPNYLKLIVILYSMGVLTSALLNRSYPIQTYAYLRPFLFSIIMATIFLKIKISNKQIKTMKYYFETFLILQIFASITTFFLIGRREGTLIGTINFGAGTYTTLLTLTGASYFLSKFLIVKKSIKYVFIIIGFFFIAWVGLKRGPWLYLPFLSLFQIYYFKKKKKRKKNVLKNFITYLLIIHLTLVALYIGVRLTPTLNPEHEKWGRFDYQHLKDYIYYYSFGDDKERLGRFGGTIDLYYNFILKKDVIKILFGEGPSTLMGGLNNPEQLRNAYFITGKDVIFTGFVFSIFSIGIFGTAVLIILYCSIFRFYQNQFYRSNTDESTQTHLFLLSVSFIFFIDFFTYSRAFFHTFFFNFLIFVPYGMYLALSKKKYAIKRTSLPYDTQYMKAIKKKVKVLYDTENNKTIILPDF